MDILATPSFSRASHASTASVGIAGAGSCLPSVAVSNEDLARLINIEGKGAAWAREKLGIESRRFMTRLDERGRPAANADELEMAEQAARKALSNASFPSDEVDALWYVSCTQPSPARQHFSASAFELHRRLGLRSNAIPLEMDAGCGGVVHAMALGANILAGGSLESMLVVASNAPSRYYSVWEAYVAAGVWLSMYIFGDGAGAVLLRRSERIRSRSRIIASYLGADPSQPLMYFEPRCDSRDPLYVIDAKAVAASFGIYAKRALDGLQKVHPIALSDIARFYFHQVNGNVLKKFVEKIGLPPARVPMHVDRYGNIAAAATLVLLDQDRRDGLVSDGDLVVFCTVGAGAQYGALLVQL